MRKMDLQIKNWPDKEKNWSLLAAGYRLVPFGPEISNRKRIRTTGFNSIKDVHHILSQIQSQSAREPCNECCRSSNQKYYKDKRSSALKMHIKTNKQCQHGLKKSNISQKKNLNSGLKSLFSSKKLNTVAKIISAVKPFICPKCERRFCSNRNLLTHQRIHTGRTFVCSKCGKCFSHKKILIAHKWLHTGRKPFTCTECNKDFLWNRDLQEHENHNEKGKMDNSHLETHSKENSYNYTEYKTSCQNKNTFKTQIKTHTKDKICI
ncbi:oocyte zinc finger protein XlCOF15-like [Xenopus laevis]|uniref:Oocyte zinc finger protein XlCOF15-like n=1 Tax=Xenopus laevis TaxID=8355 RepID=A0A8J0VI22_XENLA|nr:oocyte zinc finger protein XlCOF15-like [Xenopus laevis]